MARNAYGRGPGGAELAGEQRALDVVWAAMHRGLGPRRILRELEARPDCPPRGGRWHLSTVARIVRRLRRAAAEQGAAS